MDGPDVVIVLSLATIVISVAIALFVMGRAVDKQNEEREHPRFL